MPEIDSIIMYIQLGIITNFVCIGVELLIGIYLMSQLDFVQLRKLAMLAEENSTDNKFNYLSLLQLVHFLLPFYNVYLTVVQIYLISKYFEKTAESADFVIKEIDKYKIFRRYK